MTNQLKTGLFLDPSRYSKAYHAFENLSSKYEEFSSWSQDLFPSTVVKKLKPGLKPLRMMGIGSGAGEAESEMIHQLLAKFDEVENTVIEPSGKRISEYKETVAADYDLSQNVTFIWKPQTVEQYQKSRINFGGNRKRFHFVSALHCLYHVTDPSDTLRFMYDSLEKGGVMLVILSTADSGFGELWSRFPVLASTDANYHLLHTGHIKKTLDWLNIPYDSVYGGAFLDITPCFDIQSVEGMLALDFLTQIVDFRRWASKTLYKEVLDFLRSNQCSKKSDDGKILFYDKWEAVIVQKP